MKKKMVIGIGLIVIGLSMIILLLLSFVYTKTPVSPTLLSFALLLIGIGFVILMISVTGQEKINEVKNE